MSYHPQQPPQQNTFFNQSARPINELNTFNSNINAQQEDSDVAKPPKKRREDTNFIYDELYKATLILQPGERAIVRPGGRKNRNEVLGLTNARLTKEKHLHGNKYLRDLELSRDIQMTTNHGEFVLVLQTNGRIVAMSDDVENHLGKPMRSLYTQCVNIFECLDKTDGDKLRSILDSPVDLAPEEHRLVCTFRLPKGKRPSRTREDIKAITMAGHFYSCHDISSSYERLFIARCAALVSRTTNGSSSSQTATMSNSNDSNAMIKLTLNEDMSINMVSPNVNDILGYTRNEMMNSWLGRFLATDDLEKFETIRQRYFQHDQQQLPASVCEIFDIYTNNGDGRLTFLCQIRPIRERRSRAIRFAMVAQLIDPSLRDEYARYVQSESETNPEPIKGEQYHHQHLKRVKIPSWPIVRHSPWAYSYSTTSTAATSFISSNTRRSTDLSQTLLPRSTSMTNLGSSSLTSNVTNIREQQIFRTGQESPSMTPSSNVNQNED